MRARVWLAQGRSGAAIAWARDQNVSTEDDLGYLREFEHITLARALLAERSIDDASRFLLRLLPAAEQGSRAGSVLEILVLQTLVHQLRGDLPTAHASLLRAVALAEPEPLTLANLTTKSLTRCKAGRASDWSMRVPPSSLRFP